MSSESSSYSLWSELIEECLLNILSRLSLDQLYVGPLFVCRSWHNASKHSFLHSSFDLHSLFQSTPDNPRFWSPDFETKMDSMIRNVVNWSGRHGLTQIRTSHCSDHSLDLIAHTCPNLQLLSITTCPNVTDASMFQISFSCSRIVELDISYCYEISHESLAMIGMNCPNLKVLKRNLMNWIDPSQHVGIVPLSYLNACPQDGDVEALEIGKYMPGLQHLELRFSKLTNAGLESICEGCLNLEYLDLSGCANLTNRDITNFTSSLKNLKEIKKPNFYIPRSDFHIERYGHWSLYDDRFQTDIFRI